MLNAESYPSWFEVTYQGNRLGMHLLFPRGFSANLVLLVWSVLGSVLAYGFLSNYRTMLLSPVLETPVETAQDVFDREMIPFIELETYIDILKRSPKGRLPNSKPGKSSHLGWEFFTSWDGW